jgi:hypothetical protein
MTAAKFKPLIFSVSGLVRCIYESPLIPLECSLLDFKFQVTWIHSLHEKPLPGTKHKVSMTWFSFNSLDIVHWQVKDFGYTATFLIIGLCILLCVYQLNIGITSVRNKVFFSARFYCALLALHVSAPFGGHLQVVRKHKKYPRQSLYIQRIRWVALKNTLLRTEVISIFNWYCNMLISVHPWTSVSLVIDCKIRLSVTWRANPRTFCACYG